MKTKQPTTKNFGKFADHVRNLGVCFMPVYHTETQPKALMSMKQICDAYPIFARKTIEVYASQGLFPQPVAFMVGAQTPSWLYDRNAVEKYFGEKSRFDQKKYDEMVEKSRALQARGARLRYKADKMKNKFIITTKESK